MKDFIVEDVDLFIEKELNLVEEIETETDTHLYEERNRIYAVKELLEEIDKGTYNIGTTVSDLVLPIFKTYIAHPTQENKIELNKIPEECLKGTEKKARKLLLAGESYGDIINQNKDLEPLLKKMPMVLPTSTTIAVMADNLVKQRNALATKDFMTEWRETTKDADDVEKLIKDTAIFLETLPHIQNNAPGCLGDEHNPAYESEDNDPKIRNIFGNADFDELNEINYGAHIIAGLPSNGKSYHGQHVLLGAEERENETTLLLYNEDSMKKKMKYRIYSLRTGTPRNIYMGGKFNRWTREPFDEFAIFENEAKMNEYGIAHIEMLCKPLLNGSEIISEYIRTRDFVLASKQIADAHLAGYAANPRMLFQHFSNKLGNNNIESMLNYVLEVEDLYDTEITTILVDQITKLQYLQKDKEAYATSGRYEEVVSYANDFAEDKCKSLWLLAQANKGDGLSNSSAAIQPAQWCGVVKSSATDVEIKVIKSRGENFITLKGKRIASGQRTDFTDYSVLGSASLDSKGAPTAKEMNEMSNKDKDEEEIGE